MEEDVVGTRVIHPKPVRSSRRRLLTVGFRVAVGVAAFTLLLASSDLGRMSKVLAEARIAYLVLALGLSLGVLVVGAFRWGVYLRALRLSLPAPTLVRLYFVGTYFNAFLPTGFGGDAYKAIRLRRGAEGLGGAVASVLLDRFAGIVGLSLLGLLAAGSRAAQGDSGGVVLAATVLSVGVLVATVSLAWLGNRFECAGNDALSGLGPRIRRRLAVTVRAGRDPRAAFPGVALGFAMQGLIVLTLALLSDSLGLDLPLDALAAIQVVATVATSLPITINGLGFREGAYVWGLGAYGVPYDLALAFSLLVLGLLLTSSLVGGVVYVLAGGGKVTERG